jgi:hypothetical protein
MHCSTEIDHRLFRTHRYAIVDALYREAWQPHVEHRVLAPAFLKNDTGRCPVLLDLSNLSPARQSESLQSLHHQVQDREPTPLSLFFQTQASLDSVAAHCTARLVIKPDLTEPKQFRYFDPGTFLQLPRLLGEVGMAWLLGPFQQVTLAWAGEWLTYTVPEVPAVARADFYLTSQHYEALSRFSVVNRAALQCPPPKNIEDWCRRCERLELAVKKGQHYGLAQRDDLVLFAVHAETVHPRFDEHPRLQTVLQQLQGLAAEEELDYRELTQTFSASDWQTIIHELNAHELRDL